MEIVSFTTIEELSSGFTHLFKLTYKDLNLGGANTTYTATLLDYIKGDFARDAAFVLVTPFDGGATSALALDVGHDGAAVDDPDSLLDNYELHLDASEVLAGDGNGAVFATLRTGIVFVEAGQLKALFTATGGNVNALTQGEVWIYLNVTRLPGLS